MGKGAMMAFVFEDEQAQPAQPASGFVFEDVPQQPATAGSEMSAEPLWKRSLVGFAAPAMETYYGAKQLLKGGLDTEEQANLKAWKEMSGEAPIAATIAGNVAPMVVGGAGLARAGLKGAAALYNPQTAMQAAKVGAGYAALQPVEGEGVGLSSRVARGAAGAATGAIGQKLADVIGGKLAAKYGARVAPADVDAEIAATLKESGQDVSAVPAQYINELRQQVGEAVAKGKGLDVKAALRAKEFESAGIKPTLGQITRDPMQYATEQNLRGVSGIGEPLAATFTAQENAMRNKVGSFAEGAADRYLAGEQIGGALSKIDESASSRVSQLYKQARESAGKDLELPLQGLAQDYASALRDFGDKIPSGVRNNLEDLGLLTGKQNKLFTVEEADRLLKVINANTSNDPAVNAALSRLRDAVKQTVLTADSEGGVFAPAVKAAAQRFKMHDMLPALKQAARGELDADKFVARHIVGSKPEAVSVMAKMLKETDEAAYSQAKAQVGEYLRRAAYGINEAGDSAFRPAGFSKALDSLGRRLNAFYSPAEIAQLRQLSRVGSYMSAPPAKAAVSTSSSGVPVTNALLGLAANKIPFGPQIAGIARSAAQSGAQRRQVAESLNAIPPQTALELAPGQLDQYQNALRSLIVPAAYAAPVIAQ